MAPSRKTYRIAAPASSANLGSGFDALGLALDLLLEVTVSHADTHRMAFRGEGEGRVPLDARNRIVAAYTHACGKLGLTAYPLRLEVENRIPLARGLGSSAAAAAAGAAAALALAGLPLDRDLLLELAVPLEGHPDNLAACIFGGFTTAAVSAAGAAMARPLPLAEWGPLALIVPAYEVPTGDARAVLPTSYDRRDVVHSLQRMGMLIQALGTGRRQDLAEALQDRLHEPYRMRLFPGADRVIAASREAGAAGICVSGAGPTLLAFPRSPVEAPRLAGELARVWRSAGHEANGLALLVSRGGVTVEEVS